MQRAALVTLRLIALGLGLGAAACEDKAAPPIVDDETIKWQLRGESVSFKPHVPGEDVDFDVSCSISGESIDFRIEAPRIAEESRPKSIIDVRRANPKSGTCIVEVTEAPNDGDGEFSLEDACKGTDPMGGCTLTGAFKSDGWDFAGTLICTKLVQQAGDREISLVSDVASGKPVTIKLDNCD